MVARNVTGEDHHDRLCETGLERWGRFGPIACERNDRRKSMMKMYVSDITLGFGNPDGVVTITAFDESSPRITFSVTIRDIRDITITDIEAVAFEAFRKTAALISELPDQKA